MTVYDQNAEFWVGYCDRLQDLWQQLADLETEMRADIEAGALPPAGAAQIPIVGVCS